jgi:hypothetical protein
VCNELLRPVDPKWHEPSPTVERAKAVEEAR